MNYSAARGEWIERFVVWAKAREDIRAVLLIGSMGRDNHYPADEWSDVDLMFITSKPDTYTQDNAWMSEVGPFWSGILPPHETFGGLMRVRCGFSVFESGVAADFMILSSTRVRFLIPIIRFFNRFPVLRRGLPERISSLGTEIGDVFRNGAPIVFDKDGLAKRLMDSTLGTPNPPTLPPSQKKFQDNVDDFWIGPPRMVAHLFRGNLVAAMKTLNFGRGDLLKMIEWHTRSKNGLVSDDMVYPQVD